MAVVSTVDSIGVRVYGNKTQGTETVEKSLSMGTLNATRYEDSKMLNIVDAMKPVLDINITKAKRTVDSFLSKSE